MKIFRIRSYVPLQIQAAHLKLFRIMKLTAFLILVTCLQVSATGFSQISLNLKNSTLTQVFTEIERQSDYVFFYEGALEHEKITVHFYNLSIEEALNACFADLPLQYRIVGKTVVVKPEAERRNLIKNNPTENPMPIEPEVANITVKGKVADSSGKGIGGATIRIKGSSRMVLSDADGFFEITDVPEGAVLQITSVGHDMLERKVKPDMGTLILRWTKVELEAVEVKVNTGYQALPKETATGSFVFFDNEQVESRTDHRIMDRLLDNIPGLQADNRGFTDNRRNYTYNIRGLNTFLTGLNGPLIVVDNFPFEGDIDLLNPADIESVTLLRDAAASSVWGARAANGVIVINLKKANPKNPFKLTFGSNINYTEKKDLWYRRTMSTSDFIDIEIDFFNRGYYDSDLKGLNSRQRVTSPLVDLLDDHRKGLVSEKELQDQIAKWRNIDYRDEYKELFLKNPIRQSYNLGLSGGNNWGNYFVSGSYEKSQSDLPSNYDNRYSLRSVTDIKPTKNLSIEIGVMYLRNEIESGDGIFNYPLQPNGGKTYYYPYLQFRDENGDPLRAPFTYNKRFVDTAGRGKLMDWTFSHLNELGKRSFNRSFENMNLTVRAKYDWNQYLSGEIRYGIERQSLFTEKIINADAFDTRSKVNTWTQIQGENIKYIFPKGAQLQEDYESILNQQFRGQINFNQKWGGQHEVAAFAASDISELKSNSSAFQALGYDIDNKTHIVVDHINPYPTFLGGNSRITSYGGFDASNKRIVSFLGNASYTYQSKYVFSISGRRDASNLLGATINEKWKPLWSTGLAWMLHKESFLNASWINQLKLRFTYGHSGNLAGGNGYYPVIYFQNDAMYSGLPYAGVSTPPDPNRKWEDTRMINIATDFAFFNNRFSGSIEYFDKKNTDLIALDKLDPTSSLVSMQKNVGIMKGNGWDIMLNSINIQTPTFSWQSSFSFSYVKDVVKKYSGSVSNGQTIASNGGKSAFPMEGYSMYSVFSLRSAGLDPQTGDPRGYDRNTGEISKNYIELIRDSVKHLVLHGPGIPPRHGFFRNTFRYKKVELSMNIVYKMGSYFREEIYGDNAYSSWSTYGNYAGRWQQPGDENHTYIPSSLYPINSQRLQFATANEDFVHKSDLIRLSDLRLGYRFNIKTGGKPIQINVNAGARNLGLLWTANKIGADPDNIYFNPQRSYNVGFNASF